MELSGDFVGQYNLPASVRWICVLWRAPLLMLATGMLLIAGGGVGPGDGDDRAAHQGVPPAKEEGYGSCVRSTQDPSYSETLWGKSKESLEPSYCSKEYLFTWK